MIRSSIRSWTRSWTQRSVRSLPRLLATFVPLLLVAPSSGFDAGMRPATPEGSDASGVLPTVEFDFADSSASESAGTLAVHLSLSTPSATDVTVPFNVSGTAADPDDYTVTASPVVILAGNLGADIVLTLVNDGLDEADETVVLTLEPPTGADLGDVTVHTATLQDDDPTPTVSFQLIHQTVGEDVGTVTVTAELSEISGLEVQIPFVHSGTAEDPADYQIDASPLVIPAGQQTGSIGLTVVNDAADEAHEHVVVKMQPPLVNAAVGKPKRHRVNIQDDDGPGYEEVIRGLGLDIVQHTFGLTQVGATAAPITVQVTNPDDIPIQFVGVAFEGDHAGDFLASYPGSLPVLLGPGASTTFDLWFAPAENGERHATAVVRQVPAGVPLGHVRLDGLAVGPTGGELVVNAGPDEYLDGGLGFWAADYGYHGIAAHLVSTADIAGTSDDPLFQTARVGAAFGYTFELPAGDYDVTLHFAETQATGAGQRVFDVHVEGGVEIDDLDLFVKGGFLGAYSSAPVRTAVSDGFLDLDLVASVGEALVSAIEVRSVPLLQQDASLLDFGPVDLGAFQEEVLTLTNNGLHDGHADTLAFVIDEASVGSGSDFYVRIGSTDYHGGAATVEHEIDLSLPAGQAVPLSVFFEPTEHAEHELALRLDGNFPSLEVNLLALGTAGSGWGYLHPVLGHEPELVVDYDVDGQEEVQLVGSESHTHERARKIKTWDWKESGATFSTLADPVRTFGLGTTAIELVIGDNNNPPELASDVTSISVHAADEVPGILCSYYDGSGGGAAALLDNVPAAADHVERITSLVVVDEDGLIGDSPFDAETMVRWQAEFDVPSTAQYEFLPTGGTDHRIEVDGQPFSGPTQLTPGTYALEARFAVVTLADLPLRLRLKIDGQIQPDFAAGLTHDENGIAPLVHALPGVGSEAGGDPITILGFGFYPKAAVTVHWGTTDLTLADFTAWGAERIDLFSPPGTGSIQVTVETPAGTSDSWTFTYVPDGPPPIVFDSLTSKEVSLHEPTTATWGPDGKLYVGVRDGRVAELAFDEDWNLLAPGVVWHPGVSGLTNSDLLGITTNPFDPPDPVKLYVGHAELFLNGGGAFSGPSPFTGQISVLTGPLFDDPQPLVDEAPGSNHDHAVNGMFFDNNGDLLWCMGGNTNAGVKYPLIGDVPASPLSGAVLLAETSRPDFNGHIEYEHSDTGVPVDDQVFGEEIDVVPGVHVSVWAHGLRNAYDLVLTTRGFIYSPDNGPNWGYGYASTGPDTDTGKHADHADELLHVEYGRYYGFANRSRGRYDGRQNVFHDLDPPSDHEFTQGILVLDPSTNGIDEYRAQAFGGQIRGQLVAQIWNDQQYLLELTADGRAVADEQKISPEAGGLDVVCGPGGAIVPIDYTVGKVRFLVPVDAGAVGLTVYDIFPWRAPSTGGTPFVIGGQGFVSGQTSVTIGSQPATVTSVTSKRIEGVLPPLPENNFGSLHDVIVSVGLDVVTLPEALLTLPPAPGMARGFWTGASALPDPLAQVSTAVVDDVLYVFGEGSIKTYAFDLVGGGGWSDTLATRLLAGHHHACETWGGRVYLFGGLEGGAEGQVQIYDPELDSWSLGAPMPWAGGACGSAVIDGVVYVCGGVVNGATVDDLSAYDPATDSWDGSGALTPMPTPVDRAAAGTDGVHLWLFGGRQGADPALDTIQRFDPATNTWESSDQAWSNLAPLPEGKSGAGRAVFLRGELYVFGGEASHGVAASAHAYDPEQNEWRAEEPLPTARRGLGPAWFGGRVLLPGGATGTGFSPSAVVEAFQR